MTAVNPSTPRPSVIQLAIKEKAALYAAYIPLFEDGGIFIPTTREYRLGDDVYVLLTLPDDPQRYPVAGKVALGDAGASDRQSHPGRRHPVPIRRKVAPAQAQDRGSAGLPHGFGTADTDRLRGLSLSGAPPA
jgi:type IV pilus assembly protein PilZ